MSDYLERCRRRLTASKRFGKLREPDGSCLCPYCDKDDTYWYPKDHELVSDGGEYYNCLRCHRWTGSPSGYCPNCNVEGYNNGEHLVDGGNELPPIWMFEPESTLDTKVLLCHTAQEVEGILFGPDENFPQYRFRHASGRWYPLGTGILLAQSTMQVIARYFAKAAEETPDWVPMVDKFDTEWDAELAASQQLAG